MGTSISYWTAHPVDSVLKASLTAEAKTLERERRWWGEPICFFEWEGKEDRLAGDSKPFGSVRRTPDGKEIDLATSASEEELELDWFMAYREMKCICEQLARWAAIHGLVFEVSLSGSPLGQVTPDGAAEVLEALREIGQDFNGGWGENESADVEREAQAWRRFPEPA